MTWMSPVSHLLLWHNATMFGHSLIISGLHGGRRGQSCSPLHAKCCKPNLSLFYATDVTDAGPVWKKSPFLHERHLPSSTSCVMATSLLQIDDHDPLVFYSPNSSWTRGGNIADFDGTSTFTATAGASATLTFTGMHSTPPLHSLSPIPYIDRPKAQGLAFGAQFSTWHLIRRHMCCRPIVSMVDLRRPSTLRNKQDSNSSKNYSNLLR